MDIITYHIHDLSYYTIAYYLTIAYPNNSNDCPWLLLIAHCCFDLSPAAPCGVSAAPVPPCGAAPPQATGDGTACSYGKCFNTMVEAMIAMINR